MVILSKILFSFIFYNIVCNSNLLYNADGVLIIQITGYLDKMKKYDL